MRELTGLWRLRRRALAAALFAAVASLVGACRREDAPVRPPPAPTAAEQGELNRGVGLMGRFEFDAARTLFNGLVQRHPDWFEARFDLALATLNRQSEGDEAEARTQLGALAKERPDDLRVLYTGALIALHEQSPGQAEPALRRVHEQDPGDAYAAYFLAQCLLAQNRAEEALALFDQADASDARLRSAHYGAAQAASRLGRTALAAKEMAEFQRQSQNPLARLAEFKYTRMGLKSEAVAAPLTQAERGTPPGPLFGGPRQIAGPLGPAAKRGAAAARAAPMPSAVDLDGDGAIDLFIPGGTRHSRVLARRDADFIEQPDHPLARIAGVDFAAWGDLDNDGLTDVLLCGAEISPMVLRQAPRGTWRPLAIPPLKRIRGARDCMLLDADHDSDLDILLVSADGRRLLLANNGDGSFRDLSERLPKAPGGAAVQLLAADLDNDRDVDLVVLHEGGPNEAIDNDLMWQWHSAAGFDAFAREPIVAAAAADIDASGEVQLVSLERDLSVHRWRREPDGWRRQDIAPPAAPGATSAPRIAVADLDGDGRPEVIVSSPRGASVWRLSPRGAEHVFEIDDPEMAAWTVVTLDERGPSFIWVNRDGSVLVRPPGAGRSPFVRVALSGRRDAAASIRSNASGIGARLAARIDGRWVSEQTLRASSGPGQSLAPTAIGLGAAGAIDFLRIDWSDGVFQTEVGLSGDAVHTIAETQRQLSSCPVLFAWDGARYAFVSDLLGVGGLGYLVAPGRYAPPRPWERFLLPAGLPQPAEGRYRVKVSEPMEEAAYVDALHLSAIDLPPGWQVALDERMQIGGPAVTGKPLYYRTALTPQRAVNDRGEDVTAALQSADGTAADPGPPDARFIGRLAREHVLSMEFAEALDTQPPALALVIDGWIEYPYSQTMFAAWQAGAAYEAPTLEARGADGRWRTVLEQFGYPAGMPRTMAVPLPALPRGTRALRLRTNQEIYWDRIAVARIEPLDAIVRDLPLAAAELRRSGFPRRTTGPQRRPAYDYERRLPLWDTRVQDGLYTAVGRIDELLTAADDGLAIIGPGEEIHAEFNAALPELPPGWTRRFVLEADGWAKDMDLYTEHASSLFPLPGRGGHTGVGERLNRRYNQRAAAG